MVKAFTKIIDYLAETGQLAPMLLCLFGFVALALASVASVPQLGISTIDTYGRNILIVLGALVLAGGLLIGIANAFLPQSSRRISPKKAGVDIEEPAHNADTYVPFRVSGKCKSIPKGYQLWLFIIGGQGGLECSPQSEITPHDGRWTTDFRATFFERGHKRRFAIFLVGEDGQALIQHYKTFGKALNQVEPRTDRPWPPLTRLTSDIVRATEIREVTLRGRTPSASA